MQGRTDSPLTEKGIRMTQRLARDFPEVGKVYASPLGRTRRTAEILFPDMPLAIDERLAEIDLGDWEGRLQADLDMEDTEQHANFWNAPHLFDLPSGETFSSVARRAIECLCELAERHSGETLALVSHTTVIRSMLFHIEQRPLSDFWHPPAVYPASVSEVYFEDGRFHIARFADISHYDPEDRPTGAY